MVRILISLLITLFVSVAFGLSAYFFKITFWGTTIFTFFLQILFFYCWNSWQQTKLLLKAELIENERIIELGKQGAVITCAFCKHPNFTLLRFDINNELKCEKCNKISSIYINIEAVQQTIPIANIQAAQLSQEQMDKLADDIIIENKL
jgi:hypothetical protein